MGIAGLVCYGVAMALAARASFLFVLPAIGVFVGAYLANERGTGRVQDLYFVGALMIGLIGIFIFKFNETRDQRQLAAYLSAHDCVVTGEIERYSPGGAVGRYGDDVDPSEYTETQYFCRSTNQNITFDQFVKGSFGQ